MIETKAGHVFDVDMARFGPHDERVRRPSRRSQWSSVVPMTNDPSTVSAEYELAGSLDRPELLVRKRNLADRTLPTGQEKAFSPVSA